VPAQRAAFFLTARLSGVPWRDNRAVPAQPRGTARTEGAAIRGHSLEEDPDNEQFSPMANTEGQGAPVEGEGEGKNDLPGPARQADSDGEGDVDQRKADADFDDLIIEVDESELQSELSGQSTVKKY
jgi:hypothetical protein